MTEPGRRTGRLQSIGPYTLIDRLGAGGMGTVYRALDRRSGTVVAFKLLHEHIAADPTAVERFRREAHVASLLRSAYVVRTLEFGQDDGRYYLVTEFVEGRSLAELLAEGAVEPLAAVDIVTHAALALDEAESRGIAHRDIKPDNILVTEDGSARLADFGIATLSYLDGLTRAGTYVGTVAYSAPEQHRGDADIRSDIYSLGVVLHQLFTGERPFDGATPAETMRLHAEAPLPSERLATLPPAIKDIIERCLAKDPADRFQHASELIAALNAARSAAESYRMPAAPALAPAIAAAAAAGVDATATSAVPPVESPPSSGTVQPVRESAGGSSRPRNPKPWLIGAGVAALLLGGFAAASALSGGDDPPSNPGSGDDGASETATATATRRAILPGGTATPGTTATRETSPGATLLPSSPTPASSLPTATPTDPAPTATATPTTTPTPQFSAPVFAPTLTESGLPPAGGQPSGGTITGCPVLNLYAYVTHSNVPIGTEFTGTWSFQGEFQAANPTFATNSRDGATNYNFGNAQGLPPGTYGFGLRIGLALVSSGTITISC